MGQEGGDVLLDGFADIPAGLLDRLAVAKTTRQRWAVSGIAHIVWFFLYHDFEVMARHPTAPLRPQ